MGYCSDLGTSMDKYQRIVLRKSITPIYLNASQRLRMLRARIQIMFAMLVQSFMIVSDKIDRI